MAVGHLFESYIVILIVLVSGNHIRYRTKYTGLVSTHPNKILLYEELYSLNSKYVYNEVAFDGGELEDDVCEIISVAVC